MNPGPPAVAVPPGIVETAVAWYVRQSSGEMSNDEHARLRYWLAEHLDHVLVWQRLQGMGQQLQGHNAVLAPDSTRSIFKRLPDPERRKALRLLSWLLVGGGGGLYLGRRHLKEAAFPADFRTAVGERREVKLADGTTLQLNTDSAVDILFDETRRRIRLRRGEIQIVTARDAANRPFWIEGRDGRLVPVGTRFTVSQRADATVLGVSRGAVDVFPNDGATARRIEAGRQWSFGRADGNEAPLDESRQAWTDGMLSAENRRLDDLLAEIGQHRPGYLGCAPEAGALRVTGTWPLHGDDPTESILASLERRLPIRTRRITRYWVRVEAR